jgi:hypothetical protein
MHYLAEMLGQISPEFHRTDAGATIRIIPGSQ